MTLFGKRADEGRGHTCRRRRNRYLREDEVSRHGHIDQGGVWINPNHPGKSYLIIGQAVLDAAVEKKTIAQDDPRILSAASVSELAALIGVNEQNLTNTINDFNSYAKNGKDPEFGRSCGSMAAFDGAAYYVIEMIPNILNTQGGPRRNVNAQILDRDGNPIPHLYSAGEMGGITAYQYQGGGNVAECITFGMIAGKNAAAPKTDALPVYKARTPVESGVQYTQGVESDIAPAAEGEIALGNNEYLGTAEGMGGTITVKVTMEGGKIAKVEVLSHKESAGIADPALAGVPEAIVAANSAEVDTVSGATITSRGIIAAVKDALETAVPAGDAPAGGVSGTFTGEAEGFSSEEKIKVTVTLDNGKITAGGTAPQKALKDGAGSIPAPPFVRFGTLQPAHPPVGESIDGDARAFAGAFSGDAAPGGAHAVADPADGVVAGDVGRADDFACEISASE